MEVRFRREVPVTRTVLFRESLLIPVTFFRVRSHCTSATGTIIQSYLSHGRGYRWLNRFRHQDFLVRRLTRQLAGLKAKRVKWRLNLLADQRLYRKRPIAILDPPPLYLFKPREGKLMYHLLLTCLRSCSLAFLFSIVAFDIRRMVLTQHSTWN